MRPRNNRNWQDKMLGGAILAGFVVIAVIAALFALATLNNDERKVDTPALSTHAVAPQISNLLIPLFVIAAQIG